MKINIWIRENEDSTKKIVHTNVYSTKILTDKDLLKVVFEDLEIPARTYELSDIRQINHYSD